MTAPRTLRLRGTDYPVLLPNLRDPRLHLAAVIVSLQVLGQVAFDFQLSIAQILISILTCAVLEVAITFRQQRVIMWPASAMLTGNGVAFILRVPGTVHGDWWSLHGWWIFAGTAAISLISKYVIRYRGRHVFNPSNFGLVACFLLLGPARAEPLDFWWGPMSVWLALALVLIVTGGFAILRRLHLLSVAIGFWLVFAAGIAVLAGYDHAMTARWHLGPITGAELWRILVFSPEILVFLFFMITDPKTVPESPQSRRAFGASIGLLAVLLIAPRTSEFATKVAVLAALALVCAARPLVDLVLSSARTRPLADRTRRRIRSAGRAAVGSVAAAGVVAATGLVFVAGELAEPGVGRAGVLAASSGELPPVAILASHGVATELDRAAADQIVVATLAWLGVPAGEVDHADVTLEPGAGQGPPIAVATLFGSQPLRFERTFELSLEDGAFTVLRERNASSRTPSDEPPAQLDPEGYVAPQLHDVAGDVGLRFRHGAFRYSASSSDAPAMMGGGLCWIDYDADGWLDLFVVNSYAEREVARWREAGDLPRGALFHNDGGTFTDVSHGSGANLAMRGNGCVAADVDLDGHMDLYVTSNTYDALLWNRGDGTFSEIARPAGIDAYGWHAGAAVGDVNGDGLPDIFVAGYTDPNAPIPSSTVGFPTNHRGVRDLLYVNLGTDRSGQPRFREVGELAGIDPGEPEHGLGVTVLDLDGDGRLDVYVANDEDPNRLYRNEPWPGGLDADPAGLGFRLREVGGRAGVADPNAGMGIAAGDYDGNGLTDLFVSNSRGQGHALYRGTSAGGYADAGDDLLDAPALTGWGGSWVDLDRDTDLDLVLTNGDIPVTNLTDDAEPIQVLDNRSTGGAPRFEDLGLHAGGEDRLLTNGRGLSAADYDNDGDLDIAINSIGGPLILLENTTSAGNWLAVRLPGFRPGARVTAVLPDGRTLVRHAQAGGSYLSSEDPRLLFGLGDATRVRTLVIRYPDGTERHIDDVAANQAIDAPHPAG